MSLPCHQRSSIRPQDRLTTIKLSTLLSEQHHTPAPASASRCARKVAELRAQHEDRARARARYQEHVDAKQEQVTRAA